MNEVLLFPSPNWFQVSGLAVSGDGWVVYGGPSKSLCVLEPLPAGDNGILEGPQRYTAHVLNRANPEKIVSVDISPEWPKNRLVLTGSANGNVKQWTMDYDTGKFKISTKLSHNLHAKDQEGLLTVAYVTDIFAVTLGLHGTFVRWDLHANVAKVYKNLIKSFRPTCMACSPHVPLTVAVGTRQGVLFLLDLSGDGTVLQKLRSHDDEIMNVSWCPQYEVEVKKVLDKGSSKETVVDASATEPLKPNPTKSSLSERLEKIRLTEPEEKDVSAIVKNLPDDSFDDFEIVQEDDMFDIYKDHEADEFGHKKFEPEDIFVKVEEPKEEIDYLAECLKLRDDILNKKTVPEPSIESLVEKLDKTDLNAASGEGPSNRESPPKESSEKEMSLDKLETSNKETPIKEKKKDKSNTVYSTHVQKHILATIGKHGGIRIWSQKGKQIASCGISSGKSHHSRNKNSPWTTLTWCKPDMLLIADTRSNLLKCNPLELDSTNKLTTQLLHSEHKRGLHCVASNASRRPAPESPAVWTVSQDRLLVRYLLDEGTTTVYNTCGGFIYNIQACPYDSNRLAVSVGDGAIRVWTTEESETEDKMSTGRFHTYWQNVQGKVLTVDWHPTKENLLAYGTAEARVGLLEARGPDRPGRALAPALSGGVYSLCWAGGLLYACAKGDLVCYDPDKPDDPPTPIPVEVEGVAWQISAVRGSGRRLAVGSEAGGVCVLAMPPRRLLAAHYPHSKTIHTIVWHPEQTSSSNTESRYRNYLAVCSQDKTNSISILELVDVISELTDATHKLVLRDTLTGHHSTVLQLAWSPHEDARLLSTSHDGTVQVWDVVSGACLSVFYEHGATSLSAAWGPWPALPAAVLSGGADCCLRVWNAHHHPSPLYDDYIPLTRKEKKRKNKLAVPPEDGALLNDPTLAALTTAKPRPSNKFLLPNVMRILPDRKIAILKTMVTNYMDKKYLENQLEEAAQLVSNDLDFIKMFRSNKEVNEVFDSEMEHHLQYGNTEAWIVLAVFRGHIDAMMQFASEKNIICPYLLSIAPSVSNKYWKDACRLYLAQIDRLVASGEDEKLVANRSYGGPVYRKAMTLLSLQDVKGAVATLCEGRLFKEAYLLCRIRYMDTIANDVLLDWAKHCVHSGVPDMAAICYVALGQPLEAAKVLGKCSDEESLSLAADLAKAAGQFILSDNINERKSQIKVKAPKTEEVLDPLPNLSELLLKKLEVKDDGGNKENVEQNGNREEDKDEAKGEDSKESGDQNGHIEAIENV